MRLAILSDIHGNSIALDAVLADIEHRGGADRYWVLGDHVAIGHDPVGVVERLHALPNASFSRGNTDRYLFEPLGLPEPDAKPIDAQSVRRYVTMTAVFAWTLGQVQTTVHTEWLRSLPLELRLTLPDGTRLLGVHASPGEDDGVGFTPGHSEAEMLERLAGCEADIVCVGHTHFPMNRHVGDVHLINASPVNIVAPFGERNATYVILEADETGYTIEHCYVPVDWEACATAIQDSGHPATEFILKTHERGAYMPWVNEVENPVALFPSIRAR